MSKFNTTDQRAASGVGPIHTGAEPSGHTYEGADGYARDIKSELFLLAVSNMVGENTFYEQAGKRDDRYVKLIHRAVLADPQWTADFLTWLRSDGNMRSASLVGALEAARILTEYKTNTTASDPKLADFATRRMVASVLQRTDEPGEALAYWTATYGRKIPKPVKRGIADAIRRLYTEYGLLKYDTGSKGFRFADVIDLVHPSPEAPWQGSLFRHALERRHNRDVQILTDLPMILANIDLRAEATENPAVLLDSDAVRQAGMTWEDVLSLAGSKIDKAKLWESVIPSMGYMALLRNLRNFDEAGISDELAATIAARLADPEQVAKSRQFPFRFLAAFEQVPSLRWGHALDQALNASLANLPALSGRSLILVDTSASMTQRGMSARSKMTPAKAAAVFGVALAARQDQAVLYGFADSVFAHPVPSGSSVIREVDRFVKRTGEVGHGTDIFGALRTTYKQHDRVFVISDMQTISGHLDSIIHRHVPVYGFNLGGYQHAAFRTGVSNRHEFGGLTDATFRMVPLLEAGRDGNWPWLKA